MLEITDGRDTTCRDSRIDRDRQSHRQTHRQTDRQTDSQIVKQTDRQTDRQLGCIVIVRLTHRNRMLVPFVKVEDVRFDNVGDLVWVLSQANPRIAQVGQAGDSLRQGCFRKCYHCFDPMCDTFMDVMSP